eukprot:Pgem_evm1s10353
MKNIRVMRRKSSKFSDFHNMNLLMQLKDGHESPDPIDTPKKPNLFEKPSIMAGYV